MIEIKIKNFGPINDGLNNNNGYIKIKKFSTFIGNQATGKSSIVKLISTLSWMEKALFQGRVSAKQIIDKNWFINKYCKYQGVESYFRNETEISYKGNAYSIKYKNKKLEIIALNNQEDYLIPKIMYVPAERNFLSAIDNPGRIDNLPASLFTFLDEFNIASKTLKEDLDLPINKIKYQYQRQNKIPYILGENYKIKLSESSSGIQSMLPLYLVSRNIANFILNQKEKKLSIEMQNKLKAEMDKILFDNSLSDEVKNIKIEFTSKKYKNSCFINIIEELEQNLFPESQKNLLYSIIKFANMVDCNKLILSTHSPYIINYLTLAVKAYSVLEKVKDSDLLKDKLNKIVPLESMVNYNDLSIYQLTEDGSIVELPMNENIPTDDNFLNNLLSDTNEEFDKLLDIEEEYEN